MVDPTSPEGRCSAMSLEAGEQLIGTAPAAGRWLLVEHPGPWPPDPLDALPDAGRAAARDWTSQGGRRLQLIRRPSRRLSGAGHLVAIADFNRGEILSTRVDSLQSLRDPEQLPFQPSVGPAVLVCAHGRRDRCCAERGRPVAVALAIQYPQAVWETSHTGGHRFAATLVMLPDGSVYGRLDPSTAIAVVEAHLSAGQVAIGHLRGFAGMSPAEQVAAARHAMRPNGGRARPTVRAVTAEAGELAVVLEGHNGPVTIRVVEQDGPVRPASCGADPEPSRLWAVVTR